MLKQSSLKNTIALAGVTGLLLLGAQPSQASLIVAAPSFSAAGASGNFDITLQNTGASAVAIGGFSFAISTSNAGITFTAVSTSTSLAYIFVGHSLIGPDISISTGTTLSASDSPDTLPAPINVAAGATVGLGHITYKIANNVASGNNVITLSAFPATSLSDAAGGNIVINTLRNGNITVVPEPRTLLLFPAALGMIGFARRKLVSRR